MQSSRVFSYLRSGIVALFLLTFLPFSGAAAGQVNGNTYTHPEYGFTVEWTDEWESYDEGGNSSSLALFRTDAVQLQILAYDGTVRNAQKLVTPGANDVVLVDNSDANPPMSIIESTMYSGEIESILILEAHTMNDGEYVVLIAINVIPVLMDATLEIVPNELTLNGTPLLSGQPAGDTQQATDLTGNATSEVTDVTPDATSESGTSRTTRTSSSSETPEATEETTITRTSRSGSSDDPKDPTPESTSDVTRTSRSSTAAETPEPTEEVTPEETEIAQTDGLESFTGPLYDYTVSYDPAIWTVDAELETETSDGVRLTSANSTFTVWAWNGYGSDPVACLDGESDFYNTQSENVSDWEPILDANGDPLRYESDGLAWGVFSLTYTNSRGNSYPLVDYISCEPIPGQDAVLIVLLSSDEESYNSELDAALDVLDTLTFGEPQDPDEGRGEDTLTEVSTNLEGSVYTSDTFGYTANIPLEWQVLDESHTDTEDVLIVSNGTSVVTVWATSEFSGSLEGCVDFAAESSGLPLELDSDSTGGDFRGTYRNEAFANFVYDNDGVKTMYFVNCQPIGDTGAFLIITQDVEYSQFASERRFRSEIENGITMP